MIGETLGSYRVVSKLGEGGMGVVYVAEHPLLKKRAVAKLLHPELSQNDEIVERFFNEARAATLIEHPGIVDVFDFGQHQTGCAFILMEFLDGESLADRLKRGPLGPELTVFVGKRIASAVGAAHEHGIVHRDLKPDNVFLVPDPHSNHKISVKVLDFGIAKLAGEAAGSVKTRTGSAMGTPAYMAPEQCRSASGVDHRADIYAVGCILFEMACGRPPFVGDSLGNMIAAHLFEEPPRPGSVLQSIPESLEGVILKALAKDPDDRQASMAALSSELSGKAHSAATLVGSGAVPVSTQPSQPVAEGLAPTLASEVGGQRISEAGATPSDAPAPLGPAMSTTLGASVGQLSGSDSSPTPTPPASRGKWLAIGLGASASIALGVAATTGAFSTDDPTATKSPRETSSTATASRPHAASNSSSDATLERRPIPDDMARIDGGEFQMGSSPAQIDDVFAWCKELAGEECSHELYARELPQRTVRIDSFLLDKYEVTKSQFASWLGSEDNRRIKQARYVHVDGVLVADLHGNLAGISIEGTRFRVAPEAAATPAVQMTWLAAQRFCRARNKRLPTEAEWEWAARGERRREFPWGNDRAPRCSGVAYGRGLGPASRCGGSAGPANVGTSALDTTPEGIHDLAGNVSEWVADEFRAPYPSCNLDCRNPEVSAPDTADVLRAARGGNWGGLAEALRGAGRSRARHNQPQTNLGFRCAADVRR